MDFFEGLGKKISQTGQSAVQKTKEMADVAKINSAISEEEKKISNSYFQIGQLYAAVHKADYEDNFAQWMTVIKESESRISAYQQQIQDIKGVIRCEKCGAEIPNNVAFCSSCGAPVPKCENVVSDVNQITCPGCGQVVSPGMKFCTSCGKAMETIQQTVSERDFHQ